MGYSVRTSDYRFTAWLDADRRIVAQELYDHSNGLDESTNIAHAPEGKAIVVQLLARIEQELKVAIKNDATSAE